MLERIYIALPKKNHKKYKWQIKVFVKRGDGKACGHPLMKKAQSRLENGVGLLLYGRWVGKAANLKCIFYTIVESNSFAISIQ